ncbi:MAG: glutamate 5-kinase [Candidatus Firestonebacteria bacterium]
MRQNISKVKRIVIKLGSNLLSKQGFGLDAKKIKNIAREIVSLRKEKKDIVIVTSGAISAGMHKLGFTSRQMSISVKQTAASVGQIILMHTYENIFSDFHQTIGQVLLTKDDFGSSQRKSNARNTFLTSFKKNVIPIVNENDTTAVDEIKIGDNDNLSASVAILIDADLLIVFSDIDGLYTCDPRKHKAKAELIHEVKEITNEIEKYCSDSGTCVGTGGMITKIAAAKRVVNAGIPMIIANGNLPNCLTDIIAGKEVGTLFHPVVNK